MSRVTDIIMLTWLDDPGVAEVNAWLKEVGYSELEEISDHAGGTKVLQAEIWSAALNHFEGYEEQHVDVFRRAKWEQPEKAVLIFEREEDERWTITVADSPIAGAKP